MSVVILSVGAVVVMQALARISHAQLVAEHRASAYLFAASKMAALELAARVGKEQDEPVKGSFRVGNQAFEWQVSMTPVSEDDNHTLQSVVLAVDWRHGAHTVERRIETWLRTAKETP